MLAAGTSIDGKFDVVRSLGEGGFGQVYLARQVSLDRLVAVKLLTQGELADDTKARFEREAKLLSILSHPNIAMFLGFGVWNMQPYTVLEYVPGRTLEEVVAAKGPLPPKQAFAVLEQILNALAHAHSHGIIHRDLKPANILMAEGRATIKLIDFGLAHVVVQSHHQRLTQEGCAIGSVAYMAPEQCMGQDVDARADVYAVGCILYYMLTGQIAFAADDAIATMYKHLNAPIPAVSADKSAPINAFLARLMAKDAKERFTSAQEVLDEMKTIDAATVKVEHHVPRHSLPASDGKPFRRTSTSTVAVIVTVFLAAAAAYFAGTFISSQSLSPQTIDLGSDVTKHDLRRMPHKDAQAFIEARLAKARAAIPIVTNMPEGERKHGFKSEIETVLDTAYREAILVDAYSAAAHARMIQAGLPWLTKDVRVKHAVDAAQRLVKVGKGPKDPETQTAALELAHFLETFPEKDGRLDKESKNLAVVAEHHIEHGELDRAFILLARVPPEFAADYYLALARKSTEKGDTRGSISAYEKALLVRQNDEYHRRQHGLTLHELALAHFKARELDTALQTSKQASSELTTWSDKRASGNYGADLCDLRALIFIQTKRFDEAERELREGMKLAQEADDKGKWGYRQHEITSGYFALYMAQGQYARAEQLARECLARPGRPFKKSWLLGLGDSLAAQNQYDATRKVLAEYLAIPVREVNLDEQWAVLYRLVTIEETTKHPQAALANQDKLIALMERNPSHHFHMSLDQCRQTRRRLEMMLADAKTTVSTPH